MQICRTKTKEQFNKSDGKKFLNTTFYPDQKEINKFIKGKSNFRINKLNEKFWIR